MLWAGVAAASLFAGAKFGLRFLRGYGLTFLIINLYTFYFQFVAANSGGLWFLHLLLTGGSLLWLGIYLEKKRPPKDNPAEPEAAAAADPKPIPPPV